MPSLHDEQIIEQLQTLGELHSDAERLAIFDAYADEFATEIADSGMSFGDCISTVAVVRQTLHSHASDIEDYLADCRTAIQKQVETNKQFVAMYEKKANQKAVRAGVKVGLGLAAKELDVEGICAQTWVHILPRLSDYSYRGEGQEAAWLREQARNVARNERSKYSRRLTIAQHSQADFENTPGFAHSEEDLKSAATQPPDESDGTEE